MSRHTPDGSIWLWPRIVLVVPDDPDRDLWALADTYRPGRQVVPTQWLPFVDDVDIEPNEFPVLLDARVYSPVWIIAGLLAIMIGLLVSMCEFNAEVRAVVLFAVALWLAHALHTASMIALKVWRRNVG